MSHGRLYITGSCTPVFFRLAPTNVVLPDDYFRRLIVRKGRQMLEVGHLFDVFGGFRDRGDSASMSCKY
jgi:hypothetical protein